MGYIISRAAAGFVLLLIGAFLVTSFNYVCSAVSSLCGFGGAAFALGIVVVILGAIILLLIPIHIFGMILSRGFGG